MSTFDQKHHNLGDRQIEALLLDFFEEELPAELSELADAPLVRRAPQQAAVAEKVAEKVSDTFSPGTFSPGSRWPTRAARLLGAAVAVAGVLFLAWSVVPDSRPHAHQAPAPQQQSAGVSRTIPSSASAAANAAAHKTVAPRELLSNFVFPPQSVNYSVSENISLLGSHKYITQQGPVEQRTQLRTTSVSFYEPDSGSQVLFTVPEIEIEILASKDEGT